MITFYVCINKTQHVFQLNKVIKYFFLTSNMFLKCSVFLYHCMSFFFIYLFNDLCDKHETKAIGKRDNRHYMNQNLLL